jgi:hypothetical protein
MSTYLVRLVENKEAVGIFMAGNLDALWHSVDEMGDPQVCEYRRLGGSGLAIHWPAAGSGLFGVDGTGPDGEDVNLHDLAKGIEFSESLVRAIQDERSAWTPLYRERGPFPL